MTARIAYFISAHGYGHAARACAILLALRKAYPSFEVDIYTQVPPWIFADSLRSGFTIVDTFADVGIVQASAMDEDLPATVRRLADFIPFSPQVTAGPAKRLTDANTRLVVCDISPLGIAAARTAGIPSVLVENFTWDWIYSGYLSLEPGLQPAIEHMQEAFKLPNYHIQTRPCCAPPLSPVDLVSNPVARTPRTKKTDVRERLNIPSECRTVLVTMGGIRQNYGFLDRLPDCKDIVFIIPGVVDMPEYRGNLRLLPHHSDFYHPDLLASSDAVVGKIGYSTLAEAYHAGIPFGYVAREKLRESDCLRTFVDKEMASLEFSQADFDSGAWAAQVEKLFDLTRPNPPEENGANQVARFLLDVLERGG